MEAALFVSPIYPIEGCVSPTQRSSPCCPRTRSAPCAHRSPLEALSADTSRGFELTSIKAAFVVERLNQVFGPCGAGWRYVHSPFEWVEGEVITEVALQFQVADSGGNAVVWDSQSHGWAFVPDSEGWSWPILSPGGRRPGKGTAPLTDARKGAITDGLTKAASMIGVGHEVFKGLVRVAQPGRAPEGAQATRQPQQPRTPAPAPQQPHSAPQAPQQPPDDPGVSRNGKQRCRPAEAANEPGSATADRTALPSPRRKP